VKNADKARILPMKKELRGDEVAWLNYTNKHQVKACEVKSVAHEKYIEAKEQIQNFLIFLRLCDYREDVPKSDGSSNADGMWMGCGRQFEGGRQPGPLCCQPRFEFELNRKFRLLTIFLPGAQIVLLQELFERVYFCQKQNYDHLKFATSLEENNAVTHFRSLAKELSVVLPISFYERQGNARSAAPPPSSVA